MKDLKLMTATELERAESKADKAVSKACDALIEAGRGHEYPKDTRAQSDPLSLAWCAAMDHCREVSAERNRRMTYHGSLKRIIQK